MSELPFHEVATGLETVDGELSGIVADLLRSEARKRRSSTSPPCFVCGKYAALGINQLHHIIPVAVLSKLIVVHDKDPCSNPTVWLCPTHHVVAHSTRLRMSDLDLSERVKYRQLSAMQIAALEANITAWIDLEEAE